MSAIQRAQNIIATQLSNVIEEDPQGVAKCLQLLASMGAAVIDNADDRVKAWAYFRNMIDRAEAVGTKVSEAMDKGELDEVMPSGLVGLLILDEEKSVLARMNMPVDYSEDVALLISQQATRTREATGEHRDALELQNKLSGEMISRIVKPFLAAGYAPFNCLLLAESVLCGVILMVTRLGGDEPVLDVVMGRVRERLAEIRLGNIEPGGHA